MRKRNDPSSGSEQVLGMFEALTRLVPFLRVPRPRRNHTESQAAFRRRARKAAQKAKILKHKFHEHRLHSRLGRRMKRGRTASSIGTEFLSVGESDTTKEEEPVPVISSAKAPTDEKDGSDSFPPPREELHPKAATQSHGIWDGKTPPASAASSPVHGASGIRWFFQWLHLPMFGSKTDAHPSAVPTIAAPRPASRTISSSLTDLDALFGAPAATLPPADASPPPSAPAQFIRSPAVQAAIEQAEKNQAAGVSAVSAGATPPAPETKEAQKKAVAIPAQLPKPAEFVFKPMVRSQRSGFKDFLGALRTIGLGHEKNALIQNLATMLDAGLPLVDSLKTLKADTRSRTGKQLLQHIVDAVENGSPLWRAFEDEHCFSPDVIALVRIGEEAGNLAENMSYLATQQEKDQALRSKVKMAMIYPTIVLVIMLIIVMGLGLFVLPNLISVLFSLNVPLPLVTRIVIAFTNFFSAHGTVAVPGVIGSIVLVIVLAKFTRFKIVTQWLMFKIPGIGRLAREATIARFGVILGGLLQAGVPLVDAIRSLAEVTSIVSYKSFYLDLLEHVNLGDSFGKSFVSIRGSMKLLPVTVQQLVTTGERSGSLAKILLKIADIYEKKANDTAQKLPVILEPILLLFIGALVGTIALAIIVPIYSIVGNVGQ